MQEEAYLGRGKNVPEHLREHGQVVVVHPDDVPLLVHVLDRVGEALVHGLFGAGLVLCRFGVVPFGVVPFGVVSFRCCSVSARAVWLARAVLVCAVLVCAVSVCAVLVCAVLACAVLECRFMFCFDGKNKTKTHKEEGRGG